MARVLAAALAAVALVVVATTLGAGSSAASVAREGRAGAAPTAARQSLIAPAAACPDLGTGSGAQERQMLCLVNFARHAAGKPRLAGNAGLHRAASHKDADILACDEFSHEACGREFAYWVERFTRCRSIAENIAWGTGSLGGVRAIFNAWMHSPGHRENILGPYRESGIALRTGTLEGNPGAHVWAQDFGAEC